jgi:hypothetical protein
MGLLTFKYVDDGDSRHVVGQVAPLRSNDRSISETSAIIYKMTKRDS